MCLQACQVDMLSDDPGNPILFLSYVCECSWGYWYLTYGHASGIQTQLICHWDGELLYISVIIHHSTLQTRLTHTLLAWLACYHVLNPEVVDRLNDIRSMWRLDTHLNDDPIWQHTHNILCNLSAFSCPASIFNSPYCYPFGIYVLSVI